MKYKVLVYCDIYKEWCELEYFDNKEDALIFADSIAMSDNVKTKVRACR